MVEHAKETDDRDIPNSHELPPVGDRSHRPDELCARPNRYRILQQLSCSIANLSPSYRIVIARLPEGIRTRGGLTADMYGNDKRQGVYAQRSCDTYVFGS